MEQQQEIENTDQQIEGEKDQKEDYEQRKTEEKNYNAENKEMGTMQTMEQPQEIKNMDQ